MLAPFSVVLSALVLDVMSLLDSSPLLENGALHISLFCLKKVQLSYFYVSLVIPCLDTYTSMPIAWHLPPSYTKTFFA